LTADLVARNAALPHTGDSFVVPRLLPLTAKEVPDGQGRTCTCRAIGGTILFAYRSTPFPAIALLRISACIQAPECQHQPDWSTTGYSGCSYARLRCCRRDSLSFEDHAMAR
jgi:hypothetical protein